MEFNIGLSEKPQHCNPSYVVVTKKAPACKEGNCRLPIRGVLACVIDIVVVIV